MYIWEMYKLCTGGIGDDCHEVFPRGSVSPAKLQVVLS
jgi:hypothetical protein